MDEYVNDHGDGYCDAEVSVDGKPYRVYFRKKTDNAPMEALCRRCMKVDPASALDDYSVGALDYVQDDGYNRLDPKSTEVRRAIEEVTKLLQFDSRICRDCVVKHLKELEAKL